MNSLVYFVHISHCCESFFTGLIQFSSLWYAEISLIEQRRMCVCTGNIQVGKYITRFSINRKLCNLYLESYHISLPHYFLLGNQKHLQLLIWNIVQAFVNYTDLVNKLVQFLFRNHFRVGSASYNYKLVSNICEKLF